MCGIAGYYIFTPGTKAPLNVKVATRLLRHRGPDEEGHYWGDCVGLGTRRLSIIDLETGQQPMTNETKTIWVAFNGEIYNYWELRILLEEKGHQFTTRSDTEVLVHGYEEWGDHLPRHLRGMFAFAVYDQRPSADGPRSAVGSRRSAIRGRLFLARDHFGIKPLYYARVNGTLIFASEIKSLLSCPDLSREIDQEAIDQYLSFLYIPEPRTIFKAIRALPPGHSLTCQGERVDLCHYWKFQPQPERYSSREEAVEQIRWALEDSVQAMMVADVPLGLFLSGGMDSSSILAMMVRHTREPVQTFSIGFGSREKSWDELEPARRIAAFFKTEHQEFRVDPDIVHLLPQAIRHFDQPFGNPTALILYLLSGETRRYVKVALGGTGGDEMFGGYPRYLGMMLYQKYKHFPKFLRKSAAGLGRYLRYDSLDESLRAHRIRRFLEGSLMPFEDCYLHFLQVMDGEGKERVLTPTFVESLEGSDPLSLARTHFQSGNGLPDIEKMMIVDVNSYLPFNQLTYTDRMTMAQSLELRVPFVDQQLIEVAGGIPLHWKIPRGITKGLFREAMAPFLPREVLRFPKRGLNLPLSLWFRNELRSWMRSLLAPEIVGRRGYFQPEAVQSLIESHEAGRQDYSLFLWALVVLEVWHQIYVDQK